MKYEAHYTLADKLALSNAKIDVANGRKEIRRIHNRVRMRAIRQQAKGHSNAR